MKYKKYVMMFLAGTMALTPAAPMVALAEDAASAAESEATEGDASAETIEESEEKEEAEETEEEVEAEKSKEAAKEAEKTEQAKEAAQTVEGIKNEAVEAQPILLEATETIPMAEEETAQDLAVGVYSVEYGIKKFGSDGKPTEVDSMAGSVQDGNMIVDVSEKDGQKVYTYYMAVKQAKIMGMDASVTGLQLDGEDVEVYATAEATKAPRVFRFRRTEKEEFFSITSTINGNMPMPAMAVVMKWDTATTMGAAIPEQKAEENPELAVGVYSVEYGIKKFGSGGKPTEDDSMAGGVKDGNMIVDVSEKDGQKVYTYYMAVKQAKIMGMDASVTGLQLDGEDVEVYATAEATKAPRVFRFRRTEKEEFFSITSTINGNMPMPAMAVVMKWDTATTKGAAIPEGDTKPEPPAATIPAPIITPAKTEAENGSEVEVSITTEQALTYGAAKEINGKTYTAVEVEVPNLQDDVVLTGYIDQMAAIPAMAARAWQPFRVVFGAADAEKQTVNVQYMKIGSKDASGVTPYLVSENLPVVKTENGYKLTLYVDAANISRMKNSQYQAAEIFYTTDGTEPTAASKKYTAPFKATGSSETKTIKAIAVLDGKSSAVSEHSITFKKASNPGKTDEITDGKYWMDVQFYHADKDVASMGDYALENNRRALVTVKNGTATIDVATNPIYRDGIVSGIGTIKCEDRDVKLEILEKNTLTTNAATFDYIESFRITLNDLTKKSVAVKFTVPNTPMEKLYPNGVPARLMLNFSGMTKANDSASLKPNSKTASKGGSSDEAFDAEDKETGVKLEAGKFVFNNGAELKAAKLTEAKDKETAEKLLKKQAEYIDLFEIKVMKGNTEVTPSGTVKLSIPVRKSETAVKLYRIIPADKKKSASAAELEFTRSKDGKYLELEVKELGQFAVVYAEADEEAPMDDQMEAPVAKESHTDISGHWAERMIRNAMQKGIMTGVGNGDFAPNAAMTRGMLITALGRMEGVKAGMYEGGSFADVKQEDYFASFVAWAVAENIASGMSETVFAPNAEVTREQLAVFLYQYAQKKGIALTGESKTFTDAEGISDWAKDAVAALTGAGLLNGRPDGSFNAKGKATRAEVATVLVKLAEMTAEK